MVLVGCTLDGNMQYLKYNLCDELSYSEICELMDLFVNEFEEPKVGYIMEDSLKFCSFSYSGNSIGKAVNDMGLPKYGLGVQGILKNIGIWAFFNFIADSSEIIIMVNVDTCPSQNLFEENPNALTYYMCSLFNAYQRKVGGVDAMFRALRYMTRDKYSQEEQKNIIDMFFSKCDYLNVDVNEFLENGYM